MHVGDLNHGTHSASRANVVSRCKFLAFTALAAAIACFFLYLAYHCIGDGYTTPAVIYAAMALVAAFIGGVSAGGGE